MARRHTARYAAGPVVFALLAACSGQGSAQAGAAGSVAREFVRARTSDPQAACALLAPRTLEQVTVDGSCTEAVSRDAPVLPDQSLRVEVYGKDAIARFAGETVFLALFDTGWKVTAAACQPRAKGRPYDCSVSGG
jgi:hypothetical protein